MFAMRLAGALGGRLDHTLANLSTLYKYRHLRITLWGDGNLVRLIRKGRARIVPNLQFEGPTCGLIPLGPPVTGTSSGLKWDLQHTRMEIGGLISSSNILRSPEVVVESDGDLLWSTEVQEERLLASFNDAKAAAGAAGKDHTCGAYQE